MPTLKRKQMVWRQKRKKKEKQSNTIKLQEKDRKRLPRSYPTYRSFEHVSKLHKIDFVLQLKELRNRFKRQRIEVLNEAAGLSRFGPVLQKKADEKFGQGTVKVTQTDIQSHDSEIVLVATQDLAKKFGKDRFHLIVSTHGALSHSPLELKTLANIVGVLKPGGNATLLHIEFEGGNLATKKIFEKLQKLFPNISIQSIDVSPNPWEKELLTKIQKF